MRCLFLPFLLSCLVACVNGPAAGPGRAELEANPPPGQAADEMPRAYEDTWWAGFASRDLQGLLSEAGESSQTLAERAFEVEAAREALVEAGALRMPGIGGDLSAGSTTSRGLADLDWSARLSAAYSPDLSGRDRAGREAARARLDSAEQSRRAQELSVTTQVASGWFSLLAARAQLAVAQDNLAISERIFAIVELRYGAGAISGFDLASQSAALSAARARLPELEARIRSLETALAVLLGDEPAGYAAPWADLLSLEVPSLSQPLASQLLLRRPDIMLAEASLRLAEADITAARAAFLPEIDLSSSISALISGGGNPVGAFSGSLSGVIFSGGQRSARLAGAEARRQARLAAYSQAVLTALGDADAAVALIRTAGRREEELIAVRTAAAEALRLAELRYAAGADDLTSLLAAQRTYFEAADVAVTARLDRLTAAVSLYAALGGAY